MKDTFKIIIVLTCVCMLCAGFLAYFFAITVERVERNKVNAISDAIRTLSPNAARNDDFLVEGLPVYKLFDKEDNSLGYAFIAQGQGYAGIIKMMAVIDGELKKIGGIAVLESVETPGLGAKINGADFQKQFKELTVIPNIVLLKVPVSKKNEVQAITGATISSRAVVKILNERIQILKENIK